MADSDAHRAAFAGMKDDLREYHVGKLTLNELLQHLHTRLYAVDDGDPFVDQAFAEWEHLEQTYAAFLNAGHSPQDAGDRDSFQRVVARFEETVDTALRRT